MSNDLQNDAYHASQSPAWKAATEEGLSYFWAHMYAGHSVNFLGQSWEDGGFSTDDAGEPKCDSRGNSVAKSSVQKLDCECDAHVQAVNEWWS